MNSHKFTHYKKLFIIGICLNIIYFIIEFGAGLYLKSLALISDAIHNLSDVLSLIISILGIYFANKKPTLNRTYGFRRASIISSLLNSILLFMAIGSIVVEAIQRIMDVSKIENPEMVWKIAFIGIFVNFGTAMLFYKDHHHDLNIKSAFLHMLADGFITVGVIISAIAISVTKFYWIDPMVSIMIACLIFWNTWKLFYESFNLILDAVPYSVDINQIKQFLENLPGVENVHDLHIWAMSTTEIALTVHIVKNKEDTNDRLLIKICRELEKKYNIHHSTIQFETQKEYKECLHCTSKI